MPGGTPAKETVAKDSTSAQTSPKTGETGAKSTPAPKPAATAEPTPAKPSTSKSPPAGQGSRQPGAGGSGPTPGHSSTTADPAQDGKVTWIADKAVKKSEWRTQTGRGSRKKAKRGLPSIADQLTSGGFPAHPAQAKKDLGKRFPKGPLFNEAEWNAFEQLSSTPQGQRWLNASGMLTLDQVKQYLSDDKDDNPEKFRGFHQLHKPSKVVLASYVSRQRNSGEGGQRFEGTPPAAVALSMEARHASDPARRDELKQEIDRGIAAEWAKTLEHTAPNDDATKAIAQGAVPNPTGSGTLSNDDVLDRYNQSIEVLTNVFHLLQEGAEIYDDSAKSHVPLRDVPVAKLLSHGGRVNIQIPAGTPPYAVTELLGITDGHGNPKAGVFPRAFGTHHIALGKGKFKEEGGHVAAIKSKLDDTELYGMNLAIGGLGLKDFNGDVILPDGAHGHIFIGHRPPRSDRPGALQIGIETTGPNAPSTVGYIHNWRSTEKTANPISSVGGLKQDKIGDDQIKNARTVDLGKLGDDWAGVLKDRADRFEHDLAERGKDAIGELVGPRTLPPEDIQDTEQRASEQRSGGPDQEPRDDEPRDPPGDRASSPKEDAQDPEQRAPEQPTRGAEQTSQDNEPRELPGDAPEQTTAKAPEASSPQPGALPTQGAQEKAPERPGQPRPEAAPQLPAGRPVDPTAITTGMQAPAPATSGSAQDQAASATGMPPDETPAPSSARKRTAAQAHSDDEQDAPASSKRAKSSGQPSSSSQAAQSAPERSGAGLLASRHIKALHDLMQMSDMSPEGLTMRGITGGGAFTSKRGNDGELSTDLRPDELDTLRQKVDDFSRVAQDLLTRTQDLPQEDLTLYRVINDLDTSSLSEGDTLDEILPSSTSWTSELALDQWVKDGGLVMKINTTSHYPTVMFSYPDEQRDEDPIAYNQAQKEVLLVPSRMTITRVTDREHNGKRFREVEVTPRELESGELDDVFQRASQRIEEKQNAKPKEKSFEVEDRAAIAEQFGDTVADEILGHVDNLPHSGEIVVRDKAGTPWRIVSADSRFGIDLQEKKATPADAAAGNADTVTGAPAPSWLHAPPQGDGAATSNVDDAASANAGTMTSAPTVPQAGDAATKQLGGAPSAANQGAAATGGPAPGKAAASTATDGLAATDSTPTNDGKASIDATLEALNEKSARWSHPATDDNKQEAAALLGELMRAQDVDESLIRRLEELIKNPDSLSQSQFAICALNGVLHALLTSDLSGFARVVAAEFSGKLFDRKGKLLADFSLPAQGEDGAATSSKVADPIQRVIRGEIPLEQAPIGNKLLQNGIKKAGAKRADVERKGGAFSDKHVLDYLLARGMGKMLSKLAREQYKADAENTARAIPGYLDKAATRPKDATGPSKKRGDLLLSANSLVTLFNDILGGDARTMVAGDGYDVSRINDVLSRPDQAPFVLATVLDGKALAERAAEFAKDPKKSRPFEDAGTFDASSTHQVVINGKITDSGTHYTVPIYSWGQTFSIDVKKEVMPKLFTVVTYGSFATAQGQAQAPATSGTAQDQAASVTGMLPDETPAPDSATKRKAAQALSDDEQGPGSSAENKKAKNAGQPSSSSSSSSSSQAAQPALARSGTGLLASRHIDALQGLMRDMSNTTPEAQTMRGIPGGGAFTSKRGEDGELSTDLRPDELDTLRQKVDDFSRVAQDLLTRTQDLPQEDLTLYRVINDLDTSSLSEGDTLDEILPSSTSWTPDLALDQWVKDGGLVMKINTTSHYPTVMFSYPDQQRDGEPIAYNQAQKEVLLVPSRMTITRVTDREHNGKRFREVEVTPTQLPPRELDAVFERASERIEENQNAKPKEKSFEVKDRAAIAKQFGDAVANEILDYVDKLPDRSEREIVVRDKAGTPWRIASADSMFGIDLEEKKATPAGRSVDPTAVTTGMQAPAPAASGSAQDQAAGATGMLPDETPAPSSARKRTAEQALNDDAQDAPASSKRAKNSGQPSSSSSSQQAPPAPGRALASRHMDALHRLMRDMSNTSPQAQTMRGIPGGGAFTSKRGTDGELSTDLRPDELTTLRQKVDDFSSVARDLLTGTQDLPQEDLTFYRVINDLDTSSLVEGGTLDELLPSSTSWTSDLALNQWVQDGGLLMKINTTSKYPTVMFSYPDAQRPGDAIAYNQDQKEVLLVPSRMTITRVTPREHNGKRFLEVEVTPRELESNELDDVFERASQRIEEKLNAKPKEVSFEVDQRPKIVAQFGDTVADEILGYVGDLPHPSEGEIVVRDKDGTPWRIVSADKDFGIALQEKKAMPADAAGSSAATVTGAPAPSPTRPPAQSDGASTDHAGALATVTGMAPIQDPAPASARKRTAAQAHSDDEQDAPASSKRARNAGEPSSSSSPQQAPPAPGRALASRHMDALQGLMRDMSNTSPQAQTMRGIPGGGAFTSKRGTDGELSTELRPDELTTLRQKVDDFSSVARDLLTRTQDLPREELTFYRVINDLDTSSLVEGGTLDELLPSSTSWTSDLALNQWVQDGGLVMKINTTSKYPTVMFSYPDQQRDGEPIAYNQDQKEVLLVPSRMTITKVTPREHNGKRFLEVEVTPRELESNELDDVFQRASERIDERLNAKPKEVSFEVDERPEIVEQFGDAVADEILRHVDKLPDPSEREIVVRDKEGTRWRIVSADERFGIDLQEKKATPADVAGSSAEAVTGASPGRPATELGRQATGQTPNGPAPGDPRASTTKDGLAATQSPPAADGNASVDAAIKALNEKSAQWSHPATGANKQEAQRLLGDLMRSQGVDEALVERLAELIENPSSLSQSQFAICALNSALHTLLTSDLGGFARVVAAEFTGKLFDRQGDLLADFSLPAQGENGAAISAQVADPIHRVLRGELPVQNAGFGNKLLLNGIKKAKAGSADRERKGSAFSGEHVLDYLLARGMGKMLSKLAPEQYKDDAENAAGVIPGYLDKTTPRAKDATGPSKKHGDLLLSANSLVTLFNKILGGDAKTMAAGADYDVGRINDVLARPDQAPFALATILDGKALAERAKEFAKDPTKSRPFEDARAIDTSSTHQVVINGKITEDGDHYVVPLHTWQQSFSIKVKKDVLPSLFPVFTYGTYLPSRAPAANDLTQSQAPMPAASGTAQDQAANVAGMLPDETPAPSSARKRAAEQAQSDDEHDAPASSKRAKNTGAPSSSSSSQTAQPAPGRALASRHVDALHGLMRDMSNTSSEAQTMRGIPGGGAFTSKRGTDGELSTELRPDELTTLRQKVDDFSSVARDLLTRTQDLPQEDLTFYRVINDLDTSSLVEGGTLDELLPSSTSWTPDLALNQWVQDGGLLMKINTTSKYPTVMFSYPDAQRPGDAIAYNQDQKEVLLVPSRMTITKVTPREHNGKRFLEVEVTPRELESDELDDVFQRASQGIEERLNAKPKVKSFDAEDRAAIAAQFGDAVADEILRHVDKLPDRSEREIVVRDKDGTPWRIASADTMFGIDLEEKKATPAGRPVDPTAITTGMQAPAPAASGSAQGQDASATGMPPDETPAPSSARKRTAAQAHSDDEQDAPASSKRAKNAGQPSSSSQPAQPAPERSGAGLLASRHIDALQGLMRDMSNTTPEAQTMRGIPGGGAFTSKRGEDGELSTDLRPDELDTLRQKIDDFSRVAQDLLTRTQDLPREDLTLYRVINDLDISSLSEGGTIDEFLPSSTSWTPDLALDQWVRDGGLVMKINTTSHYPTVMFSYPDQQRDGEPIAYNQDQKEVLLVPSRMTITRVTDREHNGKRFREVEVTPTQLPPRELDAVFERASERIKEKQNTKPKEKHFELDEQSDIAAQFGDIVTDEILRHVDELPDPSEREIVVRDKDGTRWRLVSADSMFGIDLQEKKATPADVPTGYNPALDGEDDAGDLQPRAPSSARKRTAAQAQSEDEQDAPASSKRAKNSGQPSSSSSSQAAQSPPERSGTGLLASRHIKALHDLMQMSDTSPEGLTMRGITGGGAFTSKRGEDGELRADLRLDELATLRPKVDDFSRVAQDLLTRSQDLPREDLTLYRVINDLDTSSLSEGGTIDEILPSSTSWTSELALDQWVKDGGLVMKINTTSHYPTVMFSYPDEQRDEDPIAYNQAQKEVLLVPSRMTITRVTDREHNGKRFREVEVTPTRLPPRELDAVFERASERIKEKQNTKPKEVSFEVDQRPKIVEQFGETAADEILGHVDNLPYSEEIVVRDKAGTPWRIVSADSGFGIDLQEKKATPADAAAGSADTVTGAPGPSWTHAPPQADGAATTKQFGGAPSAANQGAAATGGPAPGKTAASTTTGGLAATGSTPTTDGKASIDATLEALNEKSAQWSHPATDEDKQEAAALLGELMRAQNVDESLIERLAELIKHPDSLSQSQFAICALNGVLHALLTSDLGGFARVVAAEFSGKLFDRKGKLRADFSLPAQGEHGAATSPKVADPIQRVIRGEIPLEQAPAGNKLLHNGIKKAGAKRADVERKGGAFSDKHVLDYLLARGMGKMLSKLAPEQYKTDAEHTASAIPGYLDKAATRPKDATGPSKKRGDLLLSANSLVTLFNDILGGDAQTMVAGNDYDVSRINDVLSRPDQAPFALATVLDGKALAERAKEFAKDPKKSRPFDDAGTFNASSAHQVVINGKITDSGTHYTVPIYSWGQTFSIDVKKEVMPKLFTVVTYGSFTTAPGQTTAPAASGTGHDQAASVTGMLPDETPAPESATKRKAAQALGDDEQDAPASSKRAKNSGQPSSSSSSQASQPAPERSGTGLLASRHIDALQGLMRNMSNTTPEAQTMRGIPGGGAFTSKRGEDGELSTVLRPDELDTLRQKIDDFSRVAQDLLTATQDLNEEDITLYRVINDLDTSALSEGGTLDEFLPSSTSWTPDLALNQWVKDGGLVMKINTTSHYPTVMFSYPDQQRDGDPIAYNQDQKEVLLVPSRMTITRVTDREHNGKRFREIEVTPTALPPHELDAVFERASERIKEKLNAKPKEVSFEVGQRPKIVEQFGETAADEILGYVDDLPYSEEIVVRDKAGTAWRVVSADSGFGIDLQEKKATPADAAAGSAGTATAGTGTPPAASAASPSAITTGFNPAASVSRNAPEDMLAGYNASNSRDHAAAPTAATTSGSPSSAEQAARPQGSPLEDLIRTIEEQSSTWPRPADGKHREEAAQLLSQLLHAQGVRSSLVERLSTLIKDPASLSQSAFTNCALHSVLYTTLKNDLATASHVVVALFTGRPLGRLAGAPGAGTFGQQGSRSRALSHGLELLLSQMKGEVLPAHGPTPNRPLLNGLKTAKAKRDRLKGQGAATQELDGHLLDHLLARGLVELLGETAVAVLEKQTDDAKEPGVAATQGDLLVSARSTAALMNDALGANAKIMTSDSPGGYDVARINEALAKPDQAGFALATVMNGKALWEQAAKHEAAASAPQDPETIPRLGEVDASSPHLVAIDGPITVHGDSFIVPIQSWGRAFPVRVARQDMPKLFAAFAYGTYPPSRTPQTGASAEVNSQAPGGADDALTGMAPRVQDFDSRADWRRFNEGVRPWLGEIHRIRQPHDLRGAIDVLSPEAARLLLRLYDDHPQTARVELRRLGRFSMNDTRRLNEVLERLSESEPSDTELMEVELLSELEAVEQARSEGEASDAESLDLDQLHALHDQLDAWESAQDEFDQWARAQLDGDPSEPEDAGSERSESGDSDAGMSEPARLARANVEGMNQLHHAGKVHYSFNVPSARLDALTAVARNAGVQEELADARTGFLNPDHFEKQSSFTWRLKPGVSASKALREFFDPEEHLTIAECGTTMQAINYRTLLRAVGDEDFDRRFGGEGSSVSNEDRLMLQRDFSAQNPLQRFFAPEAATLDDEERAEMTGDGEADTRNAPSSRPAKRGGWYYIKNHELYVRRHPEGFWSGENAMYLGRAGASGEQMFSGFGVPPTTEEQLAESLASEFNHAPSETEVEKILSSRRDLSLALPTLGDLGSIAAMPLTDASMDHIARLHDHPDIDAAPREAGEHGPEDVARRLFRETLEGQRLQQPLSPSDLVATLNLSELDGRAFQSWDPGPAERSLGTWGVRAVPSAAGAAASQGAQAGSPGTSRAVLRWTRPPSSRHAGQHTTPYTLVFDGYCKRFNFTFTPALMNLFLELNADRMTPVNPREPTVRKTTKIRVDEGAEFLFPLPSEVSKLAKVPGGFQSIGGKVLSAEQIRREFGREELFSGPPSPVSPGPEGPTAAGTSPADVGAGYRPQDAASGRSDGAQTATTAPTTSVEGSREDGAIREAPDTRATGAPAALDAASIDALVRTLVAKSDTWSSPRTQADKQEAIALVTELLQQLGMDARVVDRAGEQGKDTPDSEHSACTCVR
ncbi:hypothetical protein [Sorangium sp. So ce128]|uniref:hypothetical protein n=1 Tax=Sorangium sp. So ce128 TaxID=3133281 RepID=UPI003F61F53A